MEGRSVPVAVKVDTQEARDEYIRSIKEPPSVLLGRIKPQRGGEFIWKKGRGFVPMYSKRKIAWLRFTDWLRYKRTGSYLAAVTYE